MPFPYSLTYDSFLNFCVPYSFFPIGTSFSTGFGHFMVCWEPHRSYCKVSYGLHPLRPTYETTSTQFVSHSTSICSPVLFDQPKQALLVPSFPSYHPSYPCQLQQCLRLSINQEHLGQGSVVNDNHGSWRFYCSDGQW